VTTHPMESLSAFLDDELEDAERRGVAAHLAACPSCARHLQELAAVDALARGLPPAGAPDGYLEALPGRVRRRIRADRPAATRPWVWPLAAGLALAVLAPLVLRQQLSRERSAPAVVMQAPAAPAPVTLPMDKSKDERLRLDSGVSEGKPARTPEPPAARPPRREAAAASKARDAFVAPPPAARANESDRAAQTASAAGAEDVVGARAAAAPPVEQEALAAAQEEGRTQSAGALAERSDAAPSLKKADALGRGAAEPKRVADAEKAFQENATLPASTPEEARRTREAWRRFVSLHSAGPRADEGRVRFIEAAVAVFRLTRDDADRAIAEREARAYLAVPGAPQASRVRDALRLVER
jgi:ribonuclease E